MELSVILALRSKFLKALSDKKWRVIDYSLKLLNSFMLTVDQIIISNVKGVTLVTNHIIIK